ncbi:MAG TPA: protein kinase [Kofleriaceae bacterium]|nr:protein kinase [Kofleriaceae bacterium]
MKKPIPFGKYYLLERINVGGMAEVFRAKAYGVEGFERLVAVKRILPNIAEDKEFIRMFIDEAKIAVQLNHANIAQIFDLGVVDTHYYIALEHVHGRDLRAIFDRCRQKGDPMPIAQACFISMKLCEGLDYAHNKRDQAGRELHLVHRDVSPQNVLVSFEGEVKIIDFGIAKAAGKGSKTQAGILKGKFGYMSPEQVRGLPIDRRSDIFSCGIVLYELLTGERLFVGESDFSTLEKVRNVEILPPSTYNRRIPDELERIVLKALAKDDEERYQNAIDLHDELQAFVYTAGEFYSRKDLAAWMKQVFAREIEEETAKLESYRQVAPPQEMLPDRARTKPPSAPPPGRRATLDLPASAAGPRGTKPPPVPANGRRTGEQVAAAGQLEWEEDELETAIYPDKEDGASRSASRPVAAGPGPAAMLAAQSAEPAPRNVASTARNWPPPRQRESQPPTNGSALAHGSSPAYHDEETIDEARAGLGTADPSAVVELATLAEQQRRGEPLFGDMTTGDQPSFGSGFLSQRATGGMSMSKATMIKIAAGVAVLAAIVLIVVAVMSGSKDKSPQAAAPTGTAAPGAPAATAASAAATPAAATQGAAVASVDPNSGFDLIVDPAGVKVSLDGRPIGKAPLQIRNLTDGDHLVAIEAPPGFASKSQTVTVVRGKAERVNVQLETIAIMGMFTSTPDGAKVTLLVDGEKKNLGPTPLAYKLDPRKRYEAVFKKDGYLPATRVVAMTGAERVPVDVVLEKAAGRVSSAPRDRETDRLADVVERKPEPAAEPGDDPVPEMEPSKPPAAAKPKPAPVEEEAGDAGGEGTLGLGAKPPCRIFIDGRDTGMKTPQPSISLKAGKHRITLINDEFGIKESFVVRIKAGETTKAIKDLTSRIPSE